MIVIYQEIADTLQTQERLWYLNKLMRFVSQGKHCSVARVVNSEIDKGNFQVLVDKANTITRGGNKRYCHNNNTKLTEVTAAQIQNEFSKQCKAVRVINFFFSKSKCNWKQVLIVASSSHNQKCHVLLDCKNKNNRTISSRFRTQYDHKQPFLYKSMNNNCIHLHTQT